MIKLKHVFYINLVFALLFFFSGCVSGLTSSAQSVPESLSETESDLYESGPAELPVTIAKLEAVDVDKISLEFSANSASSNLIKNSLQASTSATGTYTVTGTAGAVDTTEASYIYLVTSTTTVIETVSSDGSFSAQILASEAESVAIIPVESTQQYGGPPIYGVYSEGVVSFILTNSSTINVHQNLVIKNGYAYAGLSQPDNTYSLYQIKLDGLSVKEVTSNISSMIRFVSVDDNANISYVLQNGKVYYIRASQTTTDTSTTTWADPTLVYDYEENISDPNEFNPPTVKVFSSSNGDIFIANSPFLSAVAENQSALLIHVDSSTLEATSLIDVTNYPDIQIDMGAQNDLFVFANMPPVESSIDDYGNPTLAAVLFKLNMLNGTDAWTNRTELFNIGNPEDEIIGQPIRNIAASQNNFILYVMSNAETLTFMTLDPDDEESNQFFMNYDATAGKTYSEWAILSPSSTEDNFDVITCATNTDDDTKVNLAIHRSYLNDTGEFYRLTNSSIQSACTGAFNVDDNDRILFYQGLLDAAGDFDPQLSFIDVNTLDDSELVLDD